jgi:hypothetical protein
MRLLSPMVSPFNADGFCIYVAAALRLLTFVCLCVSPWTSKTVRLDYRFMAAGS